MDYIIKPFEPYILKAKVSVFVELFNKSEELRQRTLELSRSNAELEQFAYVASHDLREPLRKVGSFVELLSQRYRGRLDEKADEYMGYITDGVARMQALIADLLDYSRAGREEKALKSAPCGPIVLNALGNLSLLISEAGASVTHGPMPAVRAEPSQLLRLFRPHRQRHQFRGDRPPSCAPKPSATGHGVLRPRQRHRIDPKHH